MIDPIRSGLMVRVGYGPRDQVRVSWQIAPQEPLGIGSGPRGATVREFNDHREHIDLPPGPYHRIPLKLLRFLMTQASSRAIMDYICWAVLEDYGARVTKANRQKTYKRVNRAWSAEGVPSELRYMPECFWETTRVEPARILPVIILQDEDGGIHTVFGLKRSV